LAVWQRCLATFPGSFVFKTPAKARDDEDGSQLDVLLRGKIKLQERFVVVEFFFL
jgi:hypothetical protein